MFTKTFIQLCALYMFLLICDTNSETITSTGLPGDDCQMGGGVMGRCEEVGACLRDGGVVQRSGQVKLCLSQQAKIYVCCRKPHRIAEELCSAWAGYWRGEDNVCIKETPLIIGGVDAATGEFPHIAAVGVQGRRGPIDFGCGGSLISPHFVLTAAHCVREEKGKYWVQLGEHDRNFKTEEKLPRLKGTFTRSLYMADDLMKDTTREVPVKQLFEVTEVILHPQYAWFPKYNDIALLKLNRPATLTRRVLPACLHTEARQGLLSKDLVVAGWGQSVSGISELSPVLQKVGVPVNELVKCQAIIARDDRFTASVGLLEDQICAGKEDQDSCPGDSGGPLMYQEARNGSLCEQTVVGVVSFGYGCGNFGIYARVASYLDWITGYIAPNSSP